MGPTVGPAPGSSPPEAGDPTQATIGSARSTTLLFVPVVFEAPDGQDLALNSTLATFGTALDITLAEQSIKSFFLADAAAEGFQRDQI